MALLLGLLYAQNVCLMLKDGQEKILKSLTHQNIELRINNVQEKEKEVS